MLIIGVEGGYTFFFFEKKKETTIVGKHGLHKGAQGRTKRQKFIEII